MKDIALVLLAVAIAVMVITGFSWGWLFVSIFSAATLVYKAFRAGLRNTFESG
jgi:hypothetical protein